MLILSLCALWPAIHVHVVNVHISFHMIRINSHLSRGHYNSSRSVVAHTCTCKTALGVLCCFALFVCLTLLASFFLPSHLSFKNMYNYRLYSYKTERNPQK